MNLTSSEPIFTAPFDCRRLDDLLDEASIDILVATSKHNVQYLLGGYRFFFFEYMDAIGISRYLPAFVYVKGRPGDSIYLGYPIERFEKELNKFWVPTVETKYSGSTDVMRAVVAHIRRLGPNVRHIGIERAFVPDDAAAILRDGLDNVEIMDAHFPLERLRACKSLQELTLLREASERVVDSMLAVFTKAAPGMTKCDLVEALRLEEVSRGLTFEYCLVTAGTSFNRAPSDQRIEAGDIISLDSGGNYKGYIGDLCRMGILGEPDTELTDLLAAIDEIQQQARRRIRAGVHGGDIVTAAQAIVTSSPHRSYLDFLAHGMGLISHEAPRLVSTGPVPYPAYDADCPLETGMVISIETTMQHPRRGFIKLEDTVAVTETGCEGFGDAGRGWNSAGTGE